MDPKKAAINDQPDSPIDLSQLSTRRSELTSRSASESCLAGRPGPSGSSKRRRAAPKDASSLPPLLEHHRSVSSAELGTYRTPLPPPPLPPSELPSKIRCMSESRLGVDIISRNSQQHHKIGGGGQSSSNHRTALPSDGTQLDFLLRRPASESFLASR